MTETVGDVRTALLAIFPIYRRLTTLCRPYQLHSAARGLLFSNRTSSTPSSSMSPHPCPPALPPFPATSRPSLPHLLFSPPFPLLSSLPTGVNTQTSLPPSQMLQMASHAPLPFSDGSLQVLVHSQIYSYIYDLYSVHPKGSIHLAQ